ncbi:MAG: M23 family metallopeptidase, partial [Candidatus Hydrogenedentota bacterium]
MNPNRCILMAAACVLFAAAGAAPQEDTYHWPLDVDPVLTSSFGEYRTGRFHAGIDLRTYGIGQPVRAPEDGEVVRVRTSPYGYGKALYIRLADGNTAVFAHLDRFASPVA